MSVHKKYNSLEFKMYSHVLVLLALQVGAALCFSWDIIVGEETRLDFYYNGRLTQSEDIQLANDITSTIYDPVHYRVLFADRYLPNISIYSFDILTKKTQLLVTKPYTGHNARVVYDPVTQLLFWKQDSSIYQFSINPASSNKADDGNILFTLYQYCYDIAVDSCGGFIYWITDFEIGRAQFDGSERKVLIDSTVDLRMSLAIDQQTQKMYWIERIVKNSDYHVSIESADLNGKNRRTFYVLKNELHPDSLAVSKDFIYWRSFDQKAIGQLPKNHEQHEEAKLFHISNKGGWVYQIIATNYTITEQTEGNQNCEPLKSLIRSPTDRKITNVSMLCVHGTKLSGESRCEYTQGYTGERCEITTCQNYCFRGDCSVSAEGQPKCRCHAGYSGDRCEVNACHKHCLNNGICSLNEEDEPVCQCSADYEGERCEVATTHTDQSCCCQNSNRDLHKAVRQAVKEELQHTSLRFVSNKIDE